MPEIRARIIDKDGVSDIKSIGTHNADLLFSQQTFVGSDGKMYRIEARECDGEGELLDVSLVPTSEEITDWP